ncbi:MAG: hypothetical protein R3F59_21690 [Myxococcota bacterium]
MPYVVRSQGFMYNDEFNEPMGCTNTRVRRIYATREEAEDVVERLHREWLRREPELNDHIYANHGVVREVLQLLRSFSPQDAVDEDELDEYTQLLVPPGLTDDQLDELVRVARIQLAEVHEIGTREPLPPDDVDEYASDVYTGSRELFAALTRYDPAPWPPEVPAAGAVVDADPALQVAWDWVASHPAPTPPPRELARRWARELGLRWHDPVHRALVSYAPDREQLASLLARQAA